MQVFLLTLSITIGNHTTRDTENSVKIALALASR